MPAYESYFENFFATLPMSRVNFKALGTSALTTLKQADLGAEVNPHLTALQAALDGFDENLTDADEATDGDTEAFRTARTAWLTFVDDTMKDHVTPKLRKKPAYADFKKYGKSKLTRLPQPELLQDSKLLLNLYAEHAADLGSPGLPAAAQAAYQAVVAAYDTRDTTEASISQARVALPADWLALARALRRLKAQLELRFDEAADVYRFFDFSRVNKPSHALKNPKPIPPTPSAA